MNKDLIKQKISEALSASLWNKLNLKKYFEANHLDGDDVKDCGGCVFTAPQVLEIIREVSRKEKEKRESEIKSALETIDWSFLDAGGKEMKCSICGKAKPDVSERECGYSREINNYKVMEIICDACEHEHLMDI